MDEKPPLAMLAGLAHEKRDEAGRCLGRALALLRDSQARLVLLERYRDEYRRRYASSGSAGMPLDELRNFRDFLDRLDAAVAQQRAEVEVLAHGAGESRGRWLAAHTRGRSLDVLAGRAEQAQQETEARRLQKLLDEIAGRMAPLAQ